MPKGAQERRLQEEDDAHERQRWMDLPADVAARGQGWWATGQDDANLNSFRTSQIGKVRMCESSSCWSRSHFIDFFYSGSLWPHQGIMDMPLMRMRMRKTRIESLTMFPAEIQ